MQHSTHVSAKFADLSQEDLIEILRTASARIGYAAYLLERGAPEISAAVVDAAILDMDLEIFLGGLFPTS